MVARKAWTMINAQETGNQNAKASRDLALLAMVTILVLVISYFFDVFVLIVKFLLNHPRMIGYIDEVVMGLLTLSIGLAVFAWRRWLELKKETTQRIKNQEELIRVTTTQADIERIISKQLRVDMDQMKLDVREILRLLSSKHR
jgi:two-component system, NarL family, sensor histidine kinase UhpB